MISSGWAFWSGGLVALVLAFVCRWAVLYTRRQINVPVVKSDSPSQTDPWTFKKLLQKGYERYPDRAFLVDAPEGPVVVLPRAMIAEVTHLSDSALEIVEPALKYTDFEVKPVTVWTIRTYLNRYLGKNISAVVDEIREAVRDELYVQAGGWSVIPISGLVLRVVARATGRIFVGLPLSRDEAWIATQIDYARDILSVAMAMQRYSNPLVRSVMQYFNPAARQVSVRRRQARDKIASLFPDKNASSNGYETQSNNLPERALVTYFKVHREMVGPSRWYDCKFHADQFLDLSLVSLHTTAQTLVNVLYELAARPADVGILRQEIDEVFALSAGGTGTVTLEKLAKLKKLDSFLREAHRMSLADLFVMRRLVKKPVLLSDGTWLPKGTMLAIPQYHIYHDPKLYADPDDFDGLRFYKLSLQADDGQSGHQYTTASTEAPVFGYGRHSCPGRFLAATQMKTIMVMLIKDYDFALEEGAEGVPASFPWGSKIARDQSRSIRMRYKILEEQQSL